MSTLRHVSCASAFVVFFFVSTFFSSLWKFSGNYANTNIEDTHDVTAVPVMLGNIDPNRKYAVFTTTSAKSAQSLNFIFQLPLTALAWKRIGFDSVVIIVGSVKVWKSDPLLQTVLTSVRTLDAVVIFVSVHQVNSVMVSQVRNTCVLSAC